MKNEQKGAALISVFVIVLVFSLLGLAISQYLVNLNSSSLRDESLQKAFYLARSGANLVANWIYTNARNKPSILDEFVAGESTSSEPFKLGDGEVVVAVKRESDSGSELVFSVASEAKVRGYKRTVEIEVIINSLGVPPENVRELFPPDFDFDNGWLDGTDQKDPIVEWVTILGGGKGRIRDDARVPGDPPIKFPFGILIEHQEGQQRFNFFSKYLLFEHEPTSLYIKQGNTLALHSDIIVFKGHIEFEGDHHKNYGVLELHALNGVYIDGIKHGIVVFYDDVLYGKNKNNLYPMIKAGAYYFKDGLRIEGKPNMTVGSPEGLIPFVGGGAGMVWR